MTSETTISLRQTRSLKQRCGRRLLIWRHGIVAWVMAPAWTTKVLLALASFGLLGWPVYEKGWKHSIPYTCVWIGVGIWKGWRELSPKNMQLLQRNYIQRKLMLTRAIQDLQRAQDMSPSQVARFQQETLQLIAAYVRDHRLDTRGTTIFVNLLVEDGDDLVVVARDRDHRIGNARSKKWGMQCYAAISTGAPQLIGDLYAEVPDAPPGKPYRSILAIPVRYEGQILGAVSIDSSRRYHFDREFRDLVEYVQPYVSLLAWTLPRRATRLPVREPQFPQGDRP